MEVNFEEQNKNEIELEFAPNLRTWRLGSRFTGSYKKKACMTPLYCRHNADISAGTFGANIVQMVHSDIVNFEELQKS